MKLFKEEWDILIAHLGNDGAMARAQGDDEFAAYAEKRIAAFRRAQARDSAPAFPKPETRRTRSSPSPRPRTDSR